MADGNTQRPYDDVHTCGRDQKTLINVPNSSSVTIPFNDINLRNGHSYLITVVGSNSLWRYTGIFFKNSPNYLIQSLISNYVEVTVDNTNITVKNSHPEYTMSLTVEFIGYIL